jgi:flagellar motor protein MotB
MDGEILQQRSSYRQGLVLGLTMAEIMLLLVFCLLIAMATYLKREQDKRVSAEQQLQNQIVQNQRDRDTVASLLQNAAVVEKLKSVSGLTDAKEIDKYWRELVDSQTAMADLEKSGVSVKEVRDRIADLQKLKARNIDADRAIRDAATIDAINRAMAKPGQPSPSTIEILAAIERPEKSEKGVGPSGHQWPPIITLNDAAGYSFKSGSAELSSNLQEALTKTTPNEILNYIKKYDVDVIEVVGHTDEQPLGPRSSNLDRDLLSVLKSPNTIATLIPADNAGLGLARAVSVVSVLRQSPLLAQYKLIPLSGAQLVNTDETLAIQGMSREDAQRRRIEIRLRKLSPREVTVALPAPISPVVLPSTPKPAPSVLPIQVVPTPKPTPPKPPVQLVPAPKPAWTPLYTPNN